MIFRLVRVSVVFAGLLLAASLHAAQPPAGALIAKWTSSLTELKDGKPHWRGFAGHNDPVMFKDVAIKKL